MNEGSDDRERISAYLYIDSDWTKVNLSFADAVAHSPDISSHQKKNLHSGEVYLTRISERKQMTFLIHLAFSLFRCGFLSLEGLKKKRSRTRRGNLDSDEDETTAKTRRRRISDDDDGFLTMARGPRAMSRKVVTVVEHQIALMLIVVDRIEKKMSRKLRDGNV